MTANRCDTQITQAPTNQMEPGLAGSMTSVGKGWRVYSEALSSRNAERMVAGEISILIAACTD
jgi:hypothetical protein